VIDIDIDIENYCVCKQRYMNEDLTSLIEHHEKEIWDYQQKASQWVKDKNQLDGGKRIIEELSAKLVELGKINIAHQKINKKLQTRLTEVEEDNKRLSKQIQDLTKRTFGDGTY